MPRNLAEHQHCETRAVEATTVTATKSTLAPGATYQEAAALFAALADPTRLTIVHALLDRELCTCEIADVLGASDSNVSQHLRVLRGLQLVRYRRAGKFVYYRLADGHVGSILRTALTHLGHTPSATAKAS